MADAARQQGSTTAQLKHDIDSGRTGDKAPGFDPAASPLGTDDEAGGTPPSPEVIEHARQMERKADASVRPNSAEPALQPNARMHRSVPILPIVIGIVVALVVAAMLGAALL